MSEKNKKVNVQPFLDDMAIDSLTSDEEQLRRNLEEAGLDPDEEIRSLRNVASQAIQAHLRKQIQSLPDQVPDSPSEIRALLDRIVALPNAPQAALTMAAREGTGASDHDLRLMAEQLLELIKREHDA